MSTHTLLSSLRAPVVQAPMAGAQDHRLSLAVCGAGGLGSLPAAMLTPQALHTELLALKSETDAPYNVNFFCHTPPCLTQRAKPVGTKFWPLITVNWG